MSEGQELSSSSVFGPGNNLVMGQIPPQKSDSQGPRERDTEVRRRLNAMDQTLSQAVRQWEESGELRRLRGRPIDLSDDSPEWFANRLLKQEGVSHPLLERGRDVDTMKAEADAVAERLRSLGRRLAHEHPTDSAVRSFNQLRQSMLDDYQRRLLALNRGVLAFNSTVPDMLHKRQISVSDAVKRLAEEVPALSRAGLPLPDDGTRLELGLWQRIVRLLHISR